MPADMLASHQTKPRQSSALPQHPASGSWQSIRAPLPSARPIPAAERIYSPCNRVALCPWLSLNQICLPAAIVH